MVEMCTLFIILEYNKYVCLLRNADRYDYKGSPEKKCGFFPHGGGGPGRGGKKIHTFFEGFPNRIK